MALWTLAKRSPGNDEGSRQVILDSQLTIVEATYGDLNIYPLQTMDPVTVLTVPIANCTCMLAVCIMKVCVSLVCT